jgi:AraC-like DNA-binding protein
MMQNVDQKAPLALRVWKWDPDFELPTPGILPFFVNARWHAEDKFGLAHIHHGVELGVIAEGTMRLYINGVIHELNRNDCYYTSGMAPHCGAIRPSGKCYIVYARISVQTVLNIPPPENGFNLLQLFQNPTPGPVVRNAADIVPALKQAHSHFKPNNIWELSESWAYVIMALNRLRNTVAALGGARISEFDRKKQTAIVNAVNYIHTNLQNEFELADVARHCCMSLSHFAHLFKDVMRCSAIHYRNMIRVEQALDRILHTDESIEKIAFDCGFSSLSFFRDFFKRCYGHAPAYFRKKQ